MLISYPALFYYIESEATPFFVAFPDFANSGTQGKDISDVLFMATDWLGTKVSSSIESDQNLPIATDIQSLSLENNNPYPADLEYVKAKSFISMVLVDLDKYLDASQPVKKTLTIPKWADNVGKKLKLNFSQTLTDAIAEKRVEYRVKDKKLSSKQVLKK